MKNIEYNGTVTISGTKIYTHLPLTEEDSSKSVIIKFNNSVPYVITLSKYNLQTRKLNLLYELTLSDGDTIFDSTPYFINRGEYLFASCDVVGTTFLIQVELIK
jgi:hypothetical protein